MSKERIENRQGNCYMHDNINPQSLSVRGMINLIYNEVTSERCRTC